MAEDKVLKPKTFRIDKETVEKIRKIAETIGGNQQDAFTKLIDAYELQSSKSVLPDQKINIEQFEKHVSVLTHMYMISLENNQSMAETVRTENGSKGAVQALGNAFGSLTNPPFVALDGDDRTGAVSSGENLRVNGQKVSEIKRLLIYTFIYEGVANWQEADGVVTVKCPGNSDIIVRMDEYGSQKIMCAIALLENSGGTFSMQKIIQFFRDHREMDRAFNWGLRWRHGTK